MSAPEAFFRDLRALRTGAGLSIAGLADVAHFPEETLAAAETGPVVPGNPVLVAYVRGCGGDVGQWEDRWRRAAATQDAAPQDASMPVSPAVSAGPPAEARRPIRRIAVAVAAAAVVSGGAVASLPTPAADREVTGVGCPQGQDNGVALVAVKPGPPWMAADGGWTGDGCDGSSVWTVDAVGAAAVPRTVTWFFHDAAIVSRCTVSVFVPRRGALGRASYAVSGQSGALLGTVTVDQSAKAGQWIVLGSFPASEYEIQLMPAATTAGATIIAASAAAVTCSGPVNP
jgi:hypothetical protein